MTFRHLSRPSVAIVGAGVAGLICAQRLAEAGARVLVLDRDRHLGGRMATRRAGALQFDHGAQYFTAREPAFAAQAALWTRRGVAAEWHARMAVLEQGKTASIPADVRRWVGVPGMSSIAQALAEDARQAGAEVHSGVDIAAASREHDRWRLTSADGLSLGSYDFLVAALPAPQAAALLGRDAPVVAERCTVRMLPCWAAMVAFETPLPVSFDGAFVRGAPLSWVARDTSKPGRPAREAETWVLHAAPDWSAAHLDASHDAVAASLLAAFCNAADMDVPPPSYLGAHRWRMALPDEPIEDHFLWCNDTRAGACGDWCGGPRVEGAWVSGSLLGEHVAALL